MAQYLPDSDSDDELPPLWEERSTSDGGVYYVHHGTKVTQWTHPRTGQKKVVSGDLPIGWEKTILDDGKVLYVDHRNRRTTYADPRLAFATEEFAGNLRQRFDGSTTALQILHGKDMQGKVAIVTGANSGIGYETARSLALHGCLVILACRNMNNANEAVAKIKSERPAANCLTLELDLASFRSVLQFASRLKEVVSTLHMVILNAGVFGVPFELTEDGYETTFQVNHLSNWLLMSKIQSLLASGSRVVILSSESHRFANLTSPLLRRDLSPTSSAGFWSMQAYNNSKLCNMLFALELSRRVVDRGVEVFTVHPGNMVSSNISRHWWFYRLIFLLVHPFTKSLQQAASTTVYCSVAPELDKLTGIYFNNCWPCEPSKAAQDPQLAAQLWIISDEMVMQAQNKKSDQ